MEDERITLDEAAARCGLSPVSLKRAIQRGRLPALKVGSAHRGLWLVRMTDLDRYLEERPIWAKNRVENQRKRREDGTA